MFKYFSRQIYLKIDKNSDDGHLSSFVHAGISTIFVSGLIMFQDLLSIGAGCRSFYHPSGFKVLKETEEEYLMVCTIKNQ